VLQAAIPAARVEVIRPGRLMEANVPVDSLFLPGSAEMRPGQVPLVDRLVAAMSAPPPGMRYEIEFSIGSLAVAGDILPIGETPQVARAGSFARTMILRGAAGDSIVIGTGVSDPARATMLFR